MPLLKLWAGSLVMLAAVSLPLQAASPVKVGSKIDTEGALLGNIILQVLESHGVPTVNKVQLGTTPVVRGAITSGELDIYPEYTGNGAFFFKDENDAAWKNAQQGYEKVKKLDSEHNKLIWLTPAPANNSCGNFYQTRLRVSESPNMFKKILFPLVALFMLAGCAKPPTTIEVSPTITLPQQDPSLMGVTVSINGADQRTDQALAKVTRDNQIVTLTASRDLRFLLQEVLEKQMTARGYMVGPNGPVNLQIIVSQLYADVSQGNVRYNIATKADIAIIATAQNGNKMTKNYRASYNVEGAFQASNKNIADAVNSVLTDTIADMSQDTSIHEFIKQNAR